jgi:Ser/Thr protein kinase RdoA (MazF antagonist)
MITPPVQSCASAFAVPGTLLSCARFGSGLINDTYLCEFLQEGGGIRKYILQRINTAVFRRPEEVMQNIEIVTSHIVRRLRAAGIADPGSSTTELVPARDGKSYHRDETGGWWRMFHFIEDGLVRDTIVDIDHAREVGRGLGIFQSLVSDLPPGKLHDTLPGFHHTPVYLAEFDAALHGERQGRAREAAPEIDFVSRRRSLAPILTDAMNSGAIPLRVVHNDPKVNNVMVRKTSGRALCMLDLDTVKPGIVHFDFGDCVRSAANAAGEDGDLDSIRFDFSLFSAVAEGYLGEANSFLTSQEKAQLPVSIKVITFELGIRFLADYLRSDTYFRIKYPGHNLHRARVQFRLLEHIEAAEKEITSFVAGLVTR